MTTIFLVILGRLADLYGRCGCTIWDLRYSQLARCYVPCPETASSWLFSVFYRQRRGFIDRKQRGDHYRCFPEKRTGDGVGTGIMAMNLARSWDYAGGVMISAFGWHRYS